jgi:hypothetical protein
MDMFEDKIRFDSRCSRPLAGEDATGNLEYRLVGGTNAIAVIRTGVAVVDLNPIRKVIQKICILVCNQLHWNCVVTSHRIDKHV